MSAPLISAVQSKGGPCKTSTAIILAFWLHWRMANGFCSDGDKNKALFELSFGVGDRQPNHSRTERRGGAKHRYAGENDADIMIADTQAQNRFSNNDVGYV